MLSGTANRFFFPQNSVKMFTAPNQVAYYMKFIASKDLTKERHYKVLVYRHYIGL